MCSHNETRGTVLFTLRNSLSGNFDEFFHQLHTLAQLAAEQNLCGYPELDFVASLEQKAEVRSMLPASLSAEREVDQLLLKENVFMSVFMLQHKVKLTQNSVHF